MKQFEGRKAALRNLGCKVNQYETDAMGALLEEAGFTLVPFSEQADVYVINTCSVTNIADRKSRQMIHKARKMNPSAVVVAAGCYVQTALDKTGLSVDADIIIGTGRKNELVREITEYLKKRDVKAEGRDEAAGTLQDVADLRTDRSIDGLNLPKVEGHTRAYIKVEDGCDMFCSYCIIPYARGHVRSRKTDEIVRELEHLAGEGTREIVLTGIHLSSYGVDFPESEGTTWQERSRLVDLIERVAQIDGIERIRLGSLEPTIITEKNVRKLRAVDKLCPHFHLSLQSGSDSVLERMNRHYSTGQYRTCVDLLRKWFDDPAVTTDVIAGFPGETEEEFEETVRFLRDIKLYETHIFPYSRRAGTRADRMDGQLTQQKKAERVQVLEELNRQNREAFIKGKEGKKAEVLVEELADERIPNAAGIGRSGLLEQSPSGKKLYAGYTRDYIRASVASDTDIRGQIVTGTLRIESSVLLV